MQSAKNCLLSMRLYSHAVEIRLISCTPVCVQTLTGLEPRIIEIFSPNLRLKRLEIKPRVVLFFKIFRSLFYPTHLGHLSD